MANLRSGAMPNPALTPHQLLQQWPDDGHCHYCVGLSGGVDSVVLLHLLLQVRKLKSYHLSAVHVNHGIMANADHWSQFCQQLCQEWQVPFKLSQVKVHKQPGQGLEQSARRVRYQEFAETQAEVIVLAHHQDDQIETILSQLCRGSSVHNLAGMHELATKGRQRIWRPLLTVSKQDLIRYAHSHQLNHIEDDSNSDNHYLRNFMRNQILPQLHCYDPHIATKLLQSCASLQASAELQDQLAALDLSKLQCSSDLATNTTNEGFNPSLDAGGFKQLNLLRQLNLISYWLRQHGLPLPTTKQLREFNRQVCAVRNGRQPRLNLSQNYDLICKRARIYLVQRKR